MDVGINFTAHHVLSVNIASVSRSSVYIPMLTVVPLMHYCSGFCRITSAFCAKSGFHSPYIGPRSQLVVPINANFPNEITAGDASV